MLTDIFEERYTSLRMWDQLSVGLRKFLVQAEQIIFDDLLPAREPNGGQNLSSERTWARIDVQLTRELGLRSLADVVAGGGPHAGCRSFFRTASHPLEIDSYVKRRISMIELAFRAKEGSLPSRLPTPQTIETALGVADSLRNMLDIMTESQRNSFQASVEELNERFRRADLQLHYHDGYIQRLDDPLIAFEVEGPFWEVVDDELWVNVSTDMKEALDRRDNGDRDPAFYAARALESSIKIVAVEGGWTTGAEKGASAYIDDLVSPRSERFLAKWEAESLRGYFANVRNPLSHGPGTEIMPTLSEHQTAWAIEYAMIWIKALVKRRGSNS